MNCLLAGKVWSREERLQSLDSISLSELLEFAKEGHLTHALPHIQIFGHFPLIFTF
jgi:hypothetical protein